MFGRVTIHKEGLSDQEKCERSLYGTDPAGVLRGYRFKTGTYFASLVRLYAGSLGAPPKLHRNSFVPCLEELWEGSSTNGPHVPRQPVVEHHKVHSSLPNYWRAKKYNYILHLWCGPEGPDNHQLRSPPRVPLVSVVFSSSPTVAIRR